jgi:nicotinate-nucleotide adenylyltransferase
MLEIALRGHPEWSVCDLELLREGPSYTVDTLRELPGRLGLRDGAELFLIIGWDNLRGLERWREAGAMLDRVQPIVVWRGEDDPALFAHLGRELGRERLAKVERGLLRFPPAPESSTDLRARLARGEDPGASLPPGVLEYVRARGIYGARR